LAEIAQRLGRKALEALAAVAKPDTLLAWYRKLIANEFDGSRFRQRVGRPRIDEEEERLVVQMAATTALWVPWSDELSSFYLVFVWWSRKLLSPA
jgi:putative transposase